MENQLLLFFNATFALSAPVWVFGSPFLTSSLGDSVSSDFKLLSACHDWPGSGGAVPGKATFLCLLIWPPPPPLPPPPSVLLVSVSLFCRPSNTFLLPRGAT